MPAKMNAQEIPLIEEFLNYLRCERHFSPHTGKCYAADLHQFGQFLCRGPSGANGTAFTAGSPTFATRSIGGAATAVALAPVTTQIAIAPKELGDKFLAVDANIIRDFLGFLREQE